MKRKAWVISADMGYGHARAAYPLLDIAYERIITANSAKIITHQEKKTWKRFKSFYETISRLRSVPVFGKPLWNMYDNLQAISPFYPFRDLSRPSFGSMYMHHLINSGFLSSIVDHTKKNNIPFVTTFYATALAAAHAKIKDVYCIVTDTDVNRVWVPEDSKKDNLFYLTPTERASKRLLQYGVDEKNIFYTGFPLPKELTGGNMHIAKKNLSQRLHNLDPNRKYTKRYFPVIKHSLGNFMCKKCNHTFTLTYSIGGAGAQIDIAKDMLVSLKNKILKHKINVNIIVGLRLKVENYFMQLVGELDLTKELGKHLNIISALDKRSYFTKFSEVLRTTDVLWTKPSELSFYCALGIPIIIGPPLGAHEVINQKWLVTMGAGIQQEDPNYTDEWLFDWIEKGILSEAAWQGFSEAPRYGTYNVENLVFSKDKDKVRLRY